jgi:hypothetical protein
MKKGNSRGKSIWAGPIKVAISNRLLGKCTTKRNHFHGLPGTHGIHIDGVQKTNSSIQKMRFVHSYTCHREKYVLHTNTKSNLRKTNGILVPSLKFGSRNLDGRHGDRSKKFLFQSETIRGKGSPRRYIKD